MANVIDLTTSSPRAPRETPHDNSASTIDYQTTATSTGNSVAPSTTGSAAIYSPGLFLSEDDEDEDEDVGLSRYYRPYGYNDEDEDDDEEDDDDDEDIQLSSSQYSSDYDTPSSGEESVDAESGPWASTHIAIPSAEGTAASTDAAEQASKKLKVEAEVVDMVDIGDDDDIQKIVQQQMLKAQREEGAARRKIADFKCVICLDDPINLSTTPCGHLFCNECLKTTLRFGKPNAKHGKCPVCRGKVVIKDIVPLELKLIQRVQGKGKGKA
ncbi:hypothetical protein DRE_02264 [Drechslerella stenobrocha 248]|uniref:RING-type domain-containing protein n=1 Tax=Drechslerella stenobrocha 248 TaxID=1043628 RepID=W7IG63_9PEZI|nr:hypothetical protein DRE_02264 [Drechslerella stenobrocha 248]